MRFLALIWAVLLISSADGATVVCLGDSLTAGKGLTEDEAFPALVRALAARDHLVWTVINAGVSGDTTAGALRRIDWVLKAKPDVVFVALGGNDGLRGLPLDQTRTNLAAIVAKLAEHQVTVCLAGMMLPVNYGEEYRTGFAALYAQVADQTRVPLMPFLLAGVGGKPDLNQADGIHPTAEGQRIIAGNVYAFLKPVVAARAAPKTP
ncbi:MAG: arylesterase [Planctomycetes bacterium]|nr:arylesterase [Planctomycetota bacterium]